MTSRSFTGWESKPATLYFTPCCLAGSLNTLPKSKKLSREWNLLGRRMSLQQMYSGLWMGMPSAYWPGLSWGTRPTQLGVTASLFGSGVLSFVRLGAVAVAVGIVVPRWRIVGKPCLYAFYTPAAILLKPPGIFALTKW